jgi:hypothetical protein
VVTNYHKLAEDAGAFLTCIRGVPCLSVSRVTNNNYNYWFFFCFSESEVRTGILNLNTVASFHIPSNSLSIYDPFDLIYSG